MATDSIEREHGTETSRRLHREALSVIPGGVSHNVRYRDPYPIYVDRAAGAKLWDVDGNEYIDFWNNHAASILGHSPEPVVDALEEQARNGIHYGAVNEPGLKLARSVRDFVPSADRFRYCLSGTEATMYAVRLARAATGRDRIIKVIGGWHGANTDLSHVVYPPFDKPTTVGLPPGVADSVHGIRLDSSESIVESLDRFDGEVAGVIVDPRRGRIQNGAEVLATLAEERDDRGFQLIFDEVVTGFRTSPGSYQANVGITPDLTTVGKILGGGMPIGGICGRAELFEPARPDVDIAPDRRVLAGGGTFAMHPMTAAAGLATIETIRSEPVYEHTEALGERARTGLRDVVEDRGVEAAVWGFSSLVFIAFNPDRELVVPEDIKVGTDSGALLRFHDELGDRGFYFNPGSGGNVSYAMTEEHVAGLIAAADSAVAAMQSDGVV